MSCVCEKDKGPIINFLLCIEDQYTNLGETQHLAIPLRAKAAAAATAVLSRPRRPSGGDSSGQAPPSRHSVILTPTWLRWVMYRWTWQSNLAMGFLNPSSQVTKQQGSGVWENFWPPSIFSLLWPSSQVLSVTSQPGSQATFNSTESTKERDWLLGGAACAGPFG